MPVMQTPMTSKYNEIYDNVFSEIIFICNKLNLTIDFNNKTIMCNIIRKTTLENTKIIIFLLKIIILIKSEFHVKIFDVIKQFIKELDNKNLFEQFLRYYEKNWLHTNFIKFDEEYKKIIKSRIIIYVKNFTHF